MPYNKNTPGNRGIFIVQADARVSPGQIPISICDGSRGNLPDCFELFFQHSLQIISSAVHPQNHGVW